jgi:hypothetical protein
MIGTVLMAEGLHSRTNAFRLTYGIVNAIAIPAPALPLG